MSVTTKAVRWAMEIAADDIHKYSQVNRWGPDYDCSSFVISAYQQAGVCVKDRGATTTANMKKVFLSCGFKDITSEVDLSSGTGLKTGDVLLNENGRGTRGSNGHAALVKNTEPRIIHAGNLRSGIYERSYWNYPWDCVLRYPTSESDYEGDTLAGGDASAGGTNSDKVTYFTNTNEVIKVHPTIFNLPDMVFEGDLAVFVGNHNVTQSLGPFTRESTLEELASKISLEIAKSDARFTYLYEPKKGDIVRIFTPKEVFRGVIVSDDTGKKHTNSYTAVDVGWHLNKTKDTYQFTDMTVYDAVYKLFNDLSIPVVYVDEALKECKVSGVYIDKAISETLKDILSHAAGRWNFDILPQGARVYPVGTFLSAPKFRLSVNTAYIDSVLKRGEETLTSSVEDLKNSVKVISDTNVLYKTADSSSINEIGFLQEIVKIDPEKESAQTVGDAKLKELNREKVTRSFSMPVEISDTTHAGDKLIIEDAEYIVLKASHAIKKGRCTLTVEIEVD